MAKRSCLTNLLEFLEYVTDAVDHGKPVDVIYLDVEKCDLEIRVKGHSRSSKVLSFERLCMVSY